MRDTVKSCGIIFLSTINVHVSHCNLNYIKLT